MWLTRIILLLAIEFLISDMGVSFVWNDDENVYCSSRCQVIPC